MTAGRSFAQISAFDFTMSVAVGSILASSLSITELGALPGDQVRRARAFHADLRPGSYGGMAVGLIGGGVAGLKHGRHIRYERATPLANLHLTLLDKVGVPVDVIGNSTGQIPHLADV